MTSRSRIVVDTNALFRRLLLPNALPVRAVGVAIAKYIAKYSVVASDATVMELAEVLARRKFDSYVTIEERKQFLRLFGRIVEIVPVLHVVRVCRDPKERRQVPGAGSECGSRCDRDGRRSSARPGPISRHSDHDPGTVPRGGSFTWRDGRSVTRFRYCRRCDIAV